MILKEDISIKYGVGNPPKRGSVSKDLIREVKRYAKAGWFAAQIARHLQVKQGAIDYIVKRHKIKINKCPKNLRPLGTGSVLE